MPDTKVDEHLGVAGRLNATLSDIALLAAGDSKLATAFSASMLSADPEVRELREAIGTVMHHRIVRALGDDGDPAIVRALELTLQGALLNAGMGHLGYEDLPERLAEVVSLLLGGR